MREYLDSDNNPERSRIPVRSILETAEETVKKKTRADELDRLGDGTISPGWGSLSNKPSMYTAQSLYDQALHHQSEMAKHEAEMSKFVQKFQEFDAFEFPALSIHDYDALTQIELGPPTNATKKQSKKSKRSKQSNRTTGTQPSYAGSDVWNK